MFIGGFKVDYLLTLLPLPTANCSCLLPLPTATASCQLSTATASCRCSLIYSIILPGKLLASLPKIKKSTKTDFVYS